MVPAAFVGLSGVPLTANGKVDRQGAAGAGGERPALGEVYVAPRTSVEEVLAEIWAEVLGVGAGGRRTTTSSSWAATPS